MARAFTAASSHYLEYASSAPVSGFPLTIACWFRADAAIRSLLALENSSAGDTNFRLYTDTSNRGNFASGGVVSSSTNTYTTNVWSSLVGVCASATSRIAYLNGTAATTATTSASPSVNRISFGRLYQGGAPIQYHQGDGAELAVWNAALDAAEVAAYAAGASALLIRPTALVFYAPVLGQFSPEIDLMQARGLTVSGATAAAHPRIIAAAGPLVIAKPAVVAATGQGRMFQVF